MLSTSTANDLTFSMNLNNTKNEKSAYDNLTKSIHYPLNKKTNQHFIHDAYDNYPILSNQQQNSLGNHHRFFYFKSFSIILTFSF